MHSRAWLAYAVISGPALSATVPKPSQSEDSVSTSSLELIFPGNFSTTTTNASYLNGVPNEDLFSLNTGSQPSFNYSASLNNLPIGYDLPVVTNAVPQCNGAVYGTNLNRHSCFDAWRNTDWAPQRVSWGPRGPGHNFQYRLPYRWTSYDGQCVIDVVHHQYYNSDFASFAEIRYAAEQVMKKCIDPLSSPAEGGYVAKVGKDERLVVVVSKYTPDVVCGQAFQGPVYPSPCRDTLSELPVSLHPIDFSRQGLPDGRYPLPWTYRASGSICNATVDLKSNEQRETIRWFDIWAAAVATDALCIHQKKVGASRNLGKHKLGWVILHNTDKLPPPPPPLAVADK